MLTLFKGIQEVNKQQAQQLGCRERREPLGGSGGLDCGGGLWTGTQMGIQVLAPLHSTAREDDPGRSSPMIWRRAKNSGEKMTQSQAFPIFPYLTGLPPAPP